MKTKNYTEYIFKGNIDEDVIDNILKLTNFIDYDNNKKIAYILIESLQNVLRHNDSKLFNDKDSLCVVQKSNGSIYITTANIIKNERIEDFRKYLTKIKSSTKTELKKQYNEVLLSSSLSNTGGLGIITMARRSDELNFDFKPINKYFSYYYFQVKLISKKGKRIRKQNKRTKLENISVFFNR